MWQQWLNAILGLWVIVIAFISGLSTGWVWTIAITGIVIAILGFWGAASASANGVTREAFQ